MTDLHDKLSTSGLQTVLDQHPFVSEIVYRARLGSTNDLAKARANAGASEGLLVIAEEQTAGRGRLGRRWWAPAGSALLTSLLFRPALPFAPHNTSKRAVSDAAVIRTTQRLVMLCALAAADAVSDLTALPVDLKWPNDLTVHGRKVAGLLAESVFSGDRLDVVVVGLGINVNTDFACAPHFIASATSLRLELGHPVDRLPLLISYLDGVTQRYAQLKQGLNPHDEWVSRLATLSQRVTVRPGDQTVTGKDVPEGVSFSRLSGVAESVDEDGALLLRTDDGMVHRFLAVDVSLAENAYPDSCLSWGED